MMPSDKRDDVFFQSIVRCNRAKETLKGLTLNFVQAKSQAVRDTARPRLGRSLRKAFGLIKRS